MLVSDDDILFAAVNQCEALALDYNALAVSAYRRIYQVLNAKARKEDVLGPLVRCNGGG